jgi:hypothetical protein
LQLPESWQQLRKNAQDLRLKTVTLGLHHLGMRTLAFPLVALLLIAALRAAELRIRPALIGNGPKALINLIDTKKLMEKGQGDGLLSFRCYVATWGGAINPVTYRATSGSTALEKEVMSALNRCRFIPAIYNGQPTRVLLLGTVLFVVADGKPHLRIYANQDHDDIAKGNDFIAPQLITRTVHNVGPANNEMLKAGIEGRKGVVELATTVDQNGNQNAIKVLSEDPPGLNFGHATLTLLSPVKSIPGSDVKYIPGFRNGHPVDSTFTWYVWYPWVLVK